MCRDTLMTRLMNKPIHTIGDAGKVEIPVAKWYPLFGDNTYADTCLSRMTAKAYRLEFPGRDCRLKNE